MRETIQFLWVLIEVELVVKWERSAAEDYLRNQKTQVGVSEVMLEFDCGELYFCLVESLFITVVHHNII